MANNFSYIPDDAILDYQVGEDIVQLTKTEFIEMMEKNKYAISSNGVIYDQDQRGVVPAILDKWYDDRLEFKRKMVEASDKGDKEKTAYFKKVQHCIKILLNSAYGNLGMQAFRFYDIDNAEAVTITGQDIIKTTEKFAHNEFNKQLKALNGEPVLNNENVIYCDTDSVYLSADRLLSLKNLSDDQTMKKETIALAVDFQDKINAFYDVMCQRFFNVSKHCIKIGADVIARRGFWVAKKAYAMSKVYDMETNKDVEPAKLEVKGMGTVRSDFPDRFRKFMSDILNDILSDVSRDELSNKVLTFKTEMMDVPIEEIAFPSSVKEVSKWVKGKNRKPFGPLNKFKNKSGGTLAAAARITAAVYYNDFIKHFGLTDQFEKIRDGEKARWVYLRDNPYKLDVLSMKGFSDPKQVLDYIKKYIDKPKMFEKGLVNKLQSFYKALGWEYPSDNEKTAAEFFQF